MLADDEPFPDPTELIIIPDHYIYRMLYSQGISLESLGIPTLDGTEPASNGEKDKRKIWQIFAHHFYLFNGTPTGIWLTHEFSEVFGINEKLNSENAMKIYDHILERLSTKDFLPRNLFEKFNIEVLSTTDGASDSLIHHKRIKESGWNGKVIPCFRPDAVININSPSWINEINQLSEISGIEVSSYKSYIKALENRRGFLKH